MAYWRMSFRCGTGGDSLWNECFENRLAVIQYDPVDDIDLSKHSEYEPSKAWADLYSSQKSSLAKFVYDMQPGDTIYAKDSTTIVGRGIITSPYEYRKKCVIRGVRGEPWQHSRRVAWDPNFVPLQVLVGRNQIPTVDIVSSADLKKLEGEQQDHLEARPMKRFADDFDIEGVKTEYRATRTKRSDRLRRKALKQAKGVCAVCGFDYGAILGGMGIRVLQVHHTKPMSTYSGEEVTALSDLVVVCANCHLLLHLDPKQCLKVPKLRKQLEGEGYLCEDD